MTKRERIDRLLVTRGFFESRAQAQAAIAARLVSADGVAIRKPSEPVSVEAALQATRAHPYVSRGGVKLAAALNHFAIDPSGRVCLDVGASTGGFTQVLLQRGARRVYAVDVGQNQLHESLRQDPAVTVLEQTDIRSLDPARIVEAPELIVVDASFISLRHILPAALHLAAPHAQLVALIKPQFETVRSQIKKGIVRDPTVHTAVCEGIAAFVADQMRWRVAGVMPSQITGGDGNHEFFLSAAR
jgi:23S rRNA (cytidine1920-2'-O)/16S rRNA (cytidine1409-2'-O)-methyltransferase